MRISAALALLCGSALQAETDGYSQTVTATIYSTEDCTGPPKLRPTEDFLSNATLTVNNAACTGFKVNKQNFLWATSKQGTLRITCTGENYTWVMHYTTCGAYFCTNPADPCDHESPGGSMVPDYTARADVCHKVGPGRSQLVICPKGPPTGAPTPKYILPTPEPTKTPTAAPPVLKQLVENQDVAVPILVILAILLAVVLPLFCWFFKRRIVSGVYGQDYGIGEGQAYKSASDL